MFLLLLFLVFGPSNEPAYDGKTLTQWLLNTDADFVWMPNDVYGHIHNDLWEEMNRGGYAAREGSPNPVIKSGLNQEPDPATVATRQIGTNAIPRLLELMASQPTAVERNRDALAAKLPWQVSRFLLPYRTLSPAARRHIAAFHGFAALGTNAEPALPALSNLLQQPGPDFQLGYAIASIGPKGMAVLINALASTNKDATDVAAFCLGMEYPPLTSAVPALVTAVDNGQASYQVFGALGRIGGESTLVVPALTKYLANTNAFTGGYWEADMAIMILGLHGEKAWSAVPTLVNLYDGADLTTRQVIRVVLKIIDAQNVQQLLGRAPSAEDDEDPWWGGAKP